jgi:hypothetical protein
MTFTGESPFESALDWQVAARRGRKTLGFRPRPLAHGAPPPAAKKRFRETAWAPLRHAPDARRTHKHILHFNRIS